MAASMAASPGEPSLSKEQRRALALLARIPAGITEDTLVLAHGFDRAMIAGLVQEGLATAGREIVTIQRARSGLATPERPAAARVGSAA
jgi:hypothetical protein